MSDPVNDIDRQLAHRIKEERDARYWSLADLASASGVSKAMISRIERAETSATAALLGRLSGAFGMTLSTLLTRAEAEPARLVRRASQPVWLDPETGFRRTAISPSGAERLQLVEGELPAGARIAYPASAYAFIVQQIWMLDGELTFQEGALSHVLARGDCLELVGAQDCVFENRSLETCRYLVVVARR